MFLLKNTLHVCSRISLWSFFAPSVPVSAVPFPSTFILPPLPFFANTWHSACFTGLSRTEADHQLRDITFLIQWTLTLVWNHSIIMYMSLSFSEFQCLIFKKNFFIRRKFWTKSAILNSFYMSDFHEPDELYEDSHDTL